MKKRQVIVNLEEDGSLGEIRGEYKPRGKKPRTKSHDFFLCIAKNIGETDINLTSISQIILLQMDNNNRINIDNISIEKLAKQYKKSVGTFWSTLNRMVKECSLLRESHGHYFANPYYFTKTSTDKLQSLRVEWDRLMIAKLKSDIEETKSKLAQETLLNNALNILRGDK